MATWVDPNTDGLAFGPLIDVNHFVRVRYLGTVVGVPLPIQMWDEDVGAFVSFNSILYDMHAVCLRAMEFSC